jgi:hypothetical protein
MHKLIFIAHFYCTYGVQLLCLLDYYTAGL